MAGKWTLPTGYTLVKQNGDKVYHLLAPTLATRAATQCGGALVDLDGGDWASVEPGKTARGVCPACKGFWKQPKKARG